MRFFVNNNSISMPYNVERIVSVDIDNQPSRVFDRAYEFLEGGFGEIPPSGTTYHGKDLEELGQGFPTFFDPPEPSILFAISTSNAEGEIKIKGFDENGMEISETLTIGTWKGSVEGQLDGNNLPAMTTQKFAEVTSVAKPETTGYVTLDTYDPETSQVYYLSKYAPNETHPAYCRYKVINSYISKDGTCNNNILCLVKLKHVDMSEDDDVLVVQNIDAIKSMVIAIREEDANRLENAMSYEAKAVAMLNESMQNSTTINSPFSFIVSGGYYGVNMV
jgi:hypothetical protein